MRTIIRCPHCQRPEIDENVYQIGALTIDGAASEVKVDGRPRQIPYQARVFLTLLARNADRRVSRDVAMEAGSFRSVNSLHAAVAKLRKDLRGVVTIRADRDYGGYQIEAA